MFNTTRSTKAPSCLNRKMYNTEEVVKILEPMFFGKCYLCEQDELSDPEIEHFDPHEKDENKMYDWNNLYYACSRCNSIKSNTHKDLLDCCDPDTDVFRKLKCIMPSLPNDPVKITSTVSSVDTKTENTVKLLERCYNEDNTGLRGVTRVVLIEKLFSHFTKYLNYRATLVNKGSSSDEIAHAKGRLEAMINVKHPFSSFWRWHVISDEPLHNELKSKIDF